MKLNIKAEESEIVNVSDLHHFCNYQQITESDTALQCSMDSLLSSTQACP